MLVQDYTKEDLLDIWGKFFARRAAHVEATADQYPDVKAVVVEYWDIDKYDHEFAEYLLEAPDPTLRMAEVAVRDMLPPDNKCPLKVRVTGLPDDSDLPRPQTRIPISRLRVESMDMLVAVEGLVTKSTEVRPKLRVGVFECQMCEALTRVEQTGKHIMEPIECSQLEEVYVGEPGCGRAFNKTRFKKVSQLCERVNTQRIQLQEAPEGGRGAAQPERITVRLSDDLVATVQPGDRAVVNGILRAVPRGEGRKEETLEDTYIEAISIEVREYAYEDVVIAPDEKDRMRRLAASGDIVDIVRASIAPTIHGWEVEKDALSLQLFGGVSREMPDGTYLRGDIHVLLVGDPGLAKSQLLRYIARLAPRGIYASGRMATGAGLIAAAVKDDFGDGGWTLEAGALVLADRGQAVIDEFDKMSAKDRSSLHEAMEQQTAHVFKAGINAKLHTRCGVLAAANPIGGRLAECAIPSQIDLDPPLMSRFDLIFAMFDRPERDQDRAIATHIVAARMFGEDEQDVKEAAKLAPPMGIEFLRKYIAFARRLKPRMTPEVGAALVDWYDHVRRYAGAEDAIPATPRAIEAMTRLCEASARRRLSEVVELEDLQAATEVMSHYLYGVAGVPEGGLDMDGVLTGVTAQMRKYKGLKESE